MLLSWVWGHHTWRSPAGTDTRSAVVSTKEPYPTPASSETASKLPSVQSCEVLRFWVPPPSFLDCCTLKKTLFFNIILLLRKSRLLLREKSLQDTGMDTELGNVSVESLRPGSQSQACEREARHKLFAGCHLCSQPMLLELGHSCGLSQKVGACN